MDLRIISINTVYWYKTKYASQARTALPSLTTIVSMSSFWLYDSDTQQPDPNGIIEFAVRELQAAEDAGQRVWIIGHMPPNRHDTLHDQVSATSLSVSSQILLTDAS